MKKTTLSLVAGLGLLSLFGFGCNPLQSVQDKVSQKIGDSVASGVLSQASGGKVDVNSDSGNYTFKNNQTGASVSVGDNVKIPADFPTDVPLYPGAKPLTVSMGQTGVGEASVTLQSSDDVEKVTKWYEDQLKDWKQASSYSMGGNEIRSYEKETLQLSLTVLKGGDSEPGTVVTITRNDSSKDQTQQ